MKSLKWFKVKLSVIFEYVKACRFHLFVIYLFVFTLANLASICSNYWLSFWCKKNSQPVHGENHKYYYFGVFALLGTLHCVFTLTSDFIFLMMYYFASKLLQNKMLDSILKTTLGFFDTTPSGRIINRFSKDIEATERGIPDSFKSFCNCLFTVCSTVLVILFATPLFITALIPMVIVYLLLQVISIFFC